VPPFLGYSERRPYLWWVDTEERTTSQAAALSSIRQGIDEIVPLDNLLAVSCGPRWYGLPPDLSGDLVPLAPSDEQAARERSHDVDVDEDWTGKATLVWRGRPLGTITHPEVGQWYRFASMSPDGRTVAIGGSVIPRPAPAPLDELLSQPLLTGRTYEAKYESVMALVDVESNEVRICEGRFDNFCYPPAWSADGTSLAFGAPFESKRIYLTSISDLALRPVDLGKHAPMPMLDARLLPAA
jgi:hypothetical protein